MESEERNSKSTHLPRIDKSPHPRMSMADCQLMEFIKYRQKNKGKLESLGLAAYRKSKRMKASKQVTIKMPKISEQMSNMKLDISHVSELDKMTKRRNQLSAIRKKTVTEQAELDNTLENFESSVKKNKEYIRSYKDERKKSLEEVVNQRDPVHSKSSVKEIVIKDKSGRKESRANKLCLFQSIDSMLRIRYKTEGITPKQKQKSKRYIDVEELNLMTESKHKLSENPEQMRKSWRRVSVNDKMQINYGSTSFIDELNRIAEYKIKTQHCFEEYVSNFSVLVAIDISKRLRKAQ